MFKRILLPTDGSAQSERAILAGVEFAKGVGAEVVGLTVLPEFHTFTYQTEMLEASSEQFAQESQQRAQQYLAFIDDAASKAGVVCTCAQITSDDPYQAIIDAARERQCDLIVMASHGRKGLKAMLLGSETQKVLVHSNIPVLVYR
jgi:nucleotide-binding universal stress UspA family protein